MVLPLKFMVMKVSETPWDTFMRDPNDPNNTVSSGKKAQEITLIAHPNYPQSKFPGAPDENAGIARFLITDPEMIGSFHARQFVSLTVEVIE